MGDGAEGVVGEVAIAIMEGVEKGKERSGLVFPLVDEELIGFGVDHAEWMANGRVGATGDLWLGGGCFGAVLAAGA